MVLFQHHLGMETNFAKLLVHFGPSKPPEVYPAHIHNYQQD